MKLLLIVEFLIGYAAIMSTLIVWLLSGPQPATTTDASLSVPGLAANAQAQQVSEPVEQLLTRHCR